jgi:pilus assembly protein Flp/PilA
MIGFMRLCKFAKDDARGATAIEYGLIAALLVIGIIASVSGTMNASKAMWTKVAAAVIGASN